MQLIMIPILEFGTLLENLEKRMRELEIPEELRLSRAHGGNLYFIVIYHLLLV